MMPSDQEVNKIQMSMYKVKYNKISGNNNYYGTKSV